MDKKLLLFIGFILLLSTTSVAEKKIDIHVTHSFTPAKAVGLLLSPNGVIEKTGVNIDSSRKGLSILTVPFSTQEVSKNTKATAMLISKEGEIAFGEMKNITSQRSYLKLPMCQDNVKRSAVVNDTIMSNLANIESLVEIRKIRRDFVQLEIGKILTGNTLAKLQKMEEGFGFSYDKPLSADLSPIILTDRLFRILTTIKNFEANK